MTLHVYRRGHFPRETLFTLWKYADEAGFSTKLFYAQPSEATPFSQRGDLGAWVPYFDDPKRLVLIVEDEGQPMGMVWFDDVYPGHRAALNGWYRRRYWGHRTRVATKAAIGLAFEALALQSLWAYTPWPEAARHCLAVGMKPHAILRDFVLVDGHVRDLEILKMEKGDG